MAEHSQGLFPHLHLQSLQFIQEITPRLLTQRGIVTKFSVVTFKPFLGSPAVVSAFHDDVNFFKPILSHVPAEHPASALARDGVPSVHGTAPHVSDPVGVDLRVGPWLSNKRIVLGHSVPLSIGACPIHIDP